MGEEVSVGRRSFSVYMAPLGMPVEPDVNKIALTVLGGDGWGIGNNGSSVRFSLCSRVSLAFLPSAQSCFKSNTWLELTKY